MKFEATYKRQTEIVEVDGRTKQRCMSVSLIGVHPIDDEARAMPREELFEVARKSIHREI